MPGLKEEINFMDRMDSDHDARDLPQGRYRYALNCYIGSSDKDNVGSVTNVRGTKKVDFPLPDGENRTIGWTDDVDNNGIIYFVWNALDNHSILRYLIDTNTVEKILESSELKFDRETPIYHANKIQDVLCWTDRNNAPRSMLVSKAVLFTTSGGGDPEGYSAITQQILDAILYPPLQAPASVYITDATRKTNYLLGDLYQFRYRYVYDTKGKSVYSPISITPLPADTEDINGFINEQTNNVIRLTLATGSKEVIRIELVARIGNEGVWALVDVLKDFAPNNTVQYSFYNTASINAVDQNQTDLLFHNIPQLAGAQEIVNDNIIFYGDITEGYGPVEVDLDLTHNLIQFSPTELDTSVPHINKKFKSFKRGGEYQIGVVYTDGQLRSGHTNIKEAQSIYIPWWSEENTDGSLRDRINVDVDIKHQPPVWATNYRLVITKDVRHTTYQYVVIRGHDIYLHLREGDKNKATINALNNYSFTEGDRIRVVAKMRSTISTAPVVAPVIEDTYGAIVQDTLITSFSGGVIETASDIFDGKLSHELFLYEIYTPKKSNVSELFYEIGEEYEIGNPGADDRFHKGEGQDQDPADLAGTPAKINIDGYDTYVTYKDFYRNNKGSRFELRTVVGFTFGQFGNDEIQIANVDHFGELGFSDPFLLDVIGLIDPVTKESSGFNGRYEIFGVAATPFITTITLSENVSDADTSLASFSFTTRRELTDMITIVESKSFSEFYTSDHTDIGRINKIVPDLTTTRYQSMFRHGGKFIQQSNINQLFDFDAGDFRILDDNLQIHKLIATGWLLKVIQRKKVTSVYIGRTSSFNPDDTEAIILIDRTIGTVRTYDEDYGTTHPWSVVKNNHVIYFFDVDSGNYIKDSGNKLFSISDIDQKNYWRDRSKELRSKLHKKNEVVATFNEDHDLLTVSTIEMDKDFIIQRADTISFHDTSMTWKAHMNFVPEVFARLGAVMVSFVFGQIWIHDASDLFNNFYGIQYPMEIIYYSRVNPGKTKVFDAIAIHSNKKWDMANDGDISIPDNENYPQGMSSRLIESKFQQKEGVLYASFMKDMNSPGFTKDTLALLNGRPLRGDHLKLKMQNTHTTLVILHQVIVHSTPSEASR